MSSSRAKPKSQSALERELAATSLDPVTTRDELPEPGESAEQVRAIVREVPPHHGGH